MKPDGPTFDLSWRKECLVVRVDRAEATPLIKSHYLKKWPGVCVLSLGLRHRNNLVGIIIFALPPRETAKRYGGETWELARLWIDDCIPPMGESWLIGKAIRFIKVNYPAVKFLVSYADPSASHTGKIYEATNWKKDGRTDEGRKTPRFDYKDALTGKMFSRRKHIPYGTKIIRVPRISKFRFVYPLSKK